QRHQDESTRTPIDQPYRGLGHLAEGGPKAPALRLQVENSQSNQKRAPWKKFVEQMRDIEKEGLRAVDVGADFTEPGQKFADYNQFVKARDPKPTGNYPNQEYRERRKPRPPTAPRSCIFRFSETQLINNNSGQQKCINNGAFDQHSRGQ